MFTLLLSLSVGPDLVFQMVKLGNMFATSILLVWFYECLCYIINVNFILFIS